MSSVDPRSRREEALGGEKTACDEDSCKQGLQ